MLGKLAAVAVERGGPETHAASVVVVAASVVAAAAAAQVDVVFAVPVAAAHTCCAADSVAAAAASADPAAMKSTGLTVKGETVQLPPALAAVADDTTSAAAGVTSAPADPVDGPWVPPSQPFLSLQASPPAQRARQTMTTSLEAA